MLPAFIVALLLAPAAPAANGSQPPVGRALRRAEYDAITALLRPAFDAAAFARNAYASLHLYGVQPDGQPCLVELRLEVAATAPRGEYEREGGETVIGAYVFDENGTGLTGLVGGFEIAPRRAQRAAPGARKPAGGYASVETGPSHFRLEQLARFTNDTVTVRLRGPGSIAEVAVRKTLAFVTTADFVCRFGKDPLTHHDAWRRYRDAERR